MRGYVHRTDAGDLRVADSRVSLASIVYCFWRGETPETIVQSFPSLTLEQVYGAIAYYLAKRQEVDEELTALDAKWEELRATARQQNQDLRTRLLDAQKKAAS